MMIVFDFKHIFREREKGDLKNIEQPSVRDFLKQQGQWDERYTKEKGEYDEAMVRQETVQKELNIARVNYDNAVKIQEIYKQQTDNLNALYEEQDKMLEAIFGTDYASEKENVLEGEVSRTIRGRYNKDCCRWMTWWTGNRECRWPCSSGPMDGFYWSMH